MVSLKNTGLLGKGLWEWKKKSFLKNGALGLWVTGEHYF